MYCKLLWDTSIALALPGRPTQFPTGMDVPAVQTGSGLNVEELLALDVQVVLMSGMFHLEEQISLSQEDLIREGAKLLGFNRLGSSITKLMEYAIAYNKEKGRIVVGTNGNWTTAQ